MTGRNNEVHMEHALRLSADGYSHAALERFTGLLQTGDFSSDEERSLIYDEIGKIYVAQNQIETARKAFSSAVAHARTVDEKAKYEVHLATTYYVQSDFDRAYRLLGEIDSRLGKDMPDIARGMLYNNLASIQWATQFYREAAESMTTSLMYFEAAGFTAFDSVLYTNLGVCYTELRDWENAELYIHKAIGYQDDELLFAYVALARMHLLRGDYERSIEYMKKSLPLFDEFPQVVLPQKTAYVCLILAELAFHSGQSRLAKQLMEKAELQFGILGEWRASDGCRDRMLEWEQIGSVTDAQATDTLFMKRFLLIVEAWNTQELIGPSFSEFIDTRVLFASKLAERLGLSEEDKYQVVTAARLADYGMTALDTEVVKDPGRSDAAWQQYRRHPSLSAEMLQDLQLPEAVYELIESHHERQDGSGYPLGTRGTLKVSHGILQLADAYAEAVVLQQRTHSEAWAGIQAEKDAYQVTVLAAFEALFAQEQGLQNTNFNR